MENYPYKAEDRACANDVKKEDAANEVDLAVFLILAKEERASNSRLVKE